MDIFISTRWNFMYDDKLWTYPCSSESISCICGTVWHWIVSPSVWLCASGFVHRAVQGGLCVCTCTISFRSSFVNKRGKKDLWNAVTFFLICKWFALKRNTSSVSQANWRMKNDEMRSNQLAGFITGKKDCSHMLQHIWCSLNPVFFRLESHHFKGSRFYIMVGALCVQ